MREPMKYINGPMGFFAPCDTYVRWSDYAALAAENERLRKAGDAMKHWIIWKRYDFPCVNDWSADAKEGGAK